jgi:threonine aldolase
MVVGSQELIEEARRWRITQGGHLRQGGILAAPGLIALDTMIDRLKEDNDRARYLAQTLQKEGLMDLDLDTVQTNMIRGTFSPICTDGEELSEYLAEQGIMTWIGPDGYTRLVTHFWIDDQDLDKFVTALKDFPKK